MKTITEADLVGAWEFYMAMAEREPIQIECENGQTVVLMSIGDYNELVGI